MLHFKKIFLIFGLITAFFSASLAYSGEKVTILLLYAGWNANSDKAQVAAEGVAKSYQGKVDYQICNVELIESCKYLHKYDLQIPRRIPSIVVVSNNKVIFEKTYKNQSLQELKSNLDGLILPKL